MSYTIWSKSFGSSQWIFCGLQSDSEKVAVQTFTMYHLAPGETLQLRAPDGVILEERIEKSRPHDPSA